MIREVALTGLIGWILFTDVVCADSPPVVRIQPISQAVNARSNVTFRITATGSPTPAFQWRFDDSDILGATNAVLLLTNVQPSNVGSYRVALTNVAGVALSQIARLDLVSGFTRVTAAPIATQGLSAGSAWGDFDGDGFLDLFTSGDFNHLYLNNGNGTFSDVTKTDGVSGSISNQGSSIWGDFDNDGNLDLFVPNNRGKSALFRNLGRSAFTNVISTELANIPGANGRSWVDYDNDGYLDLFVANGNVGSNDYLFHNNGDGTFTRITNSAILKKTGASVGCAWADYDNDGLPDLFVADGHGSSWKDRLYHNEGNGQFRPLTNNITAETVGISCAWGDYNNDGFLDLFVSHNNAANSLFRNNGDGTFTKVTNDIVVMDTPRNFPDCAWADFDNDGWLDLFVLNGGFGTPIPSYLYRNNGDGTFSKVTTGNIVTDKEDGSGGGCAWGDYDRDGFPDLFLVNYFNGLKNVLWHNDGNSNNWISIKCEGRVSNRSAIGAKVRIRASIHGKELWQLREISGGHGIASQNSLEAQFGLGDATNVDLVRIEWPSGIVQTLTNLASKQFVIVKEPSKITVANGKPDSANFQLKLHGAKGLTYQIQSSPDLLKWESEEILTNLDGMIQFHPPITNSKLQFFRALEID